jgi:hypothetical protein
LPLFFIPLHLLIMYETFVVRNILTHHKKLCYKSILFATDLDNKLVTTRMDNRKLSSTFPPFIFYHYRLSELNDQRL